MLYTPHAAVGTTIGYFVPNMFVSIPLSIMSHFFFDVFPHSNPNPAKAKGFGKIMIALEVILGGIGMLFAAYTIAQGNTHMFINMAACGIAANMPDLLMGPYVMFKKNLFFGKEMLSFQKLIQNHVRGILGYTFQGALLLLFFIYFFV